MKQEAARRMVREAIRRGRLLRPSICSQCGRQPGPTKNGGPSIQAHHHDYSRPLDVEWLCAKCHRAVTPLPAKPGAPTLGSRNGQAKLNEELVRMIRSSPLGCIRLGRVLGVDKKTVQNVRTGKLWSHVAASPTPPTGTSQGEGEK